MVQCCKRLLSSFFSNAMCRKIILPVPNIVLVLKKYFLILCSRPIRTQHCFKALKDYKRGCLFPAVMLNKVLWEIFFFNNIGYFLEIVLLYESYGLLGSF